jgi:hypothetical protein
MVSVATIAITMSVNDGEGVVKAIMEALLK